MSDVTSRERHTQTPPFASIADCRTKRNQAFLPPLKGEISSWNWSPGRLRCLAR
jgi:hypothetical protein